jgi:signal transduction histidine kinase
MRVKAFKTFFVLMLLCFQFGVAQQRYMAMDPEQVFRPEQLVVSPEYFTPYAEENLFIEIEGDLWVKYIPEITGNESLYLQIPNLYLEHIDIYLANSITKEVRFLRKIGLRENFAGLGYGLNYSIKLPEINRGNELLMRFRGDITPLSPSWVPVRVGPLETLVKDSRTDMLISNATLAIIVGLFLFNLILLSVVKDKLYLFYVLYIFAVLQLNLFISGFYFEYLWPDNPELNVLELPLALSYVTFLLFIRQLMSSSIPGRFFNQTINGFLIFCAFMIVTIWIPAIPTIVLINTLGLAIPIFMIISILKVSKPKLRTFLLFGYLPLMLAILLYTLEDFGLFFSTFVRVHLFQLTIVWELIVFSTYLGSRYNSLENEKKAYKNKNLELLSQYARNLEAEIERRTSELKENTKLLETQGKEILAQRDLLAQTNEELELSKGALEKYSRGLESKVKERTSQLLKSNDLLDKQLKSLEQFSYIAAHNLRAPVARIKGLTNLVQMEATNGTTALVEKLEIAINDLDEIVSDLGSIIEMQRDDLKPERVNVQGALDKVIHRFSSSTDIEWKVEIQVQEIEVVPTYFDSILQNLISNSIKFQSPERQLVINFRVVKENDRIYLTYADNGIGFDADRFRQKLFKPFQRFNTRINGKGLGLYLIRSHVEASGGQIRITSIPDKGTKVDIDLPTHLKSA